MYASEVKKYEYQIQSMRSRILKYANRTMRSQHSQLRKVLLDTYGKCAITGWKNPLEIQMAHIIPKHIGYAMDYPDTDSTNNCMLLANGFHALFDGFEWTVDVFSFLDISVGSEVDAETTFKAFLLMKDPPKPGTSCIASHVDQLVKIPIRYFPSMFAHYYTYFKVNYCSWKPQDAFHECVTSQAFKDLKQLKTTTEIQDHLLSLREGVNECTAIIGHRHVPHSEDPEVRVLWNYWSYGYASWEPSEYICPQSLREYEEYVERKSDPDWKPPRSNTSKNMAL